MDRIRPVLALVVPCFNEEAMLPHTLTVLADLLSSLAEKGSIAPGSFAVFVDDGSKDATWNLIEQAGQRDPRLTGIKLSFNAGHQGALMAGMLESREAVDCIISLDADLQHDISVIPAMLQKFAQGKDIITGVRLSREGNSRAKRFFSDAFYKVMKLLKTPLGDQHADFRLLGRNVLDALACYPERNLFLRGIIASMGFAADTVPYTQSTRDFGESKYSLAKMLSLAWNGITSFSALPLRISAILSLITLGFAVIKGFFTLVDYFLGNTVTGWSSLMLTILILGSMQLFCIAIVGEYIAKIYVEVKKRPYYIVEKKTEQS